MSNINKIYRHADSTDSVMHPSAFLRHADSKTLRASSLPCAPLLSSVMQTRKRFALPRWTQSVLYLSKTPWHFASKLAVTMAFTQLHD